MHQSQVRSLKTRFVVYFLLLAVGFSVAGCAVQGPVRTPEKVPVSSSPEITSVEVLSSQDLLTVAIRGTGPITYTSVKQPVPLGVVLYFPDTQLNTSSAENIFSEPPVLSVHATQVESGGKPVTRIEILLSTDVPYQVDQNSQGLEVQFFKIGDFSGSRSAAPASEPETRMAVSTSVFQEAEASVGNEEPIHVAASSLPAAPVDAEKVPLWKRTLSETLPDVSPSLTQPQTADAVPDAEPARVLRKKAKQYTGEKIALDFYQTDIKNVFRILHEVSGKNFAIDKDVTGKVTLSLTTPVPWDQIMDLVLRMNQLGMIVEGDIIRIATLATLKAEKDLRNAQMAALQREKEQIKALEPLETRYIPISYSDAQTEVLPHIQKITTKDRGSVSVDQKNNQIIITDTAEKITQAQEIARQIDKVTSQVIIEARVVEVSETFSKELGMTLTGSVSHHGNKFISGGSVAMNYPIATSSGGSSSGALGFTLERITGTPFSIDAKLSALETNGNARILSSPKIVTLNNKKARIKQGREYGYMERDSSGGSSVEFKDVDLLLEVTPHVTPDNRISMAIMITKNDVVELVNGVPVISTNEAETQLLVNDGDTIVIGGIIKNTTSKTKESFPGLYKIPIIGWLFQSHMDEAENSELLIFMNPKIVQLEQRAAL